MRFYTNKTKPICYTWIKYFSEYGSVELVQIAREKSKELSASECLWSEIKEDVVIWQYADNFDYLFEKRLGIKSGK